MIPTWVYVAAHIASWGLLLHGLLVVADRLAEPSLGASRIVLGSAEALSGCVLFAALLAKTGGFLG